MSIYLTLPVPKTPLPELMDMKKSAKTTEMIAISFITCQGAGCKGCVVSEPFNTRPASCLLLHMHKHMHTHKKKLATSASAPTTYHNSNNAQS